MNGIKMSDCKFYVDEAARTVICVIPNTKLLLSNFIQQHFGFRDINMCFALNYDFEKELFMPKSFMGKAVCALEDEWNEETGRVIAYAKARDKCYKSFFRRANTLIQTVDRRLGDMIDAFNDMGMKLEEKRLALVEDIEERTGGPIEKE